MENNRYLNFANIQEFLAFFKERSKTIVLPEFPKSILDQHKLKLENATFQSERIEVKEFSEQAIKKLKRQLELIFINGNYKTLTFEKKIISRYLEFAKALIEYEELYKTAIKKIQLNDIENNEGNIIYEPQSNKRSRTKELIQEKFENFHKKGWQYAFECEDDYEIIVDLLTNFFEYNNYTIPKSIIKLKRTCKTKIAKLLGEVHKELSENQLRNDNQFFKIIRVLNHFHDETEHNLYKALTR